jgi:phenylpropionate dioxygenase-like ring-hydroxylating dioxygenase large terminal subunit
MTETLPYRWYTDGEVLARERERLFAHSWQYAGHTGQLAEPGSYFALTVGYVPLVVVRDRDGVLRAFVNVCRHRGAEVVSGAGRCTTLQCHYHAWTYGLDGGLRAAPRSAADPDFDREEVGLRPAQVDTWGPFVFVNADAEAPPLGETLGDLPLLVRDGGLDVDALEFHQRVDYSLEANWKVAVENYLECYHCPVAHPSFSEVVDVHPDRYLLQSGPTYASHFVRGRDGEGQFHMIWPNIKVNVMPGPPNLSIGPLLPVEPGRTDGWLDYFFQADAEPEWIADYLTLDYQVGAEDRDLVESVQRGMRSGAFEHGRLLLPSEELIGSFQQWVATGLDYTPSRANDSSQERE